MLQMHVAVIGLELVMNILEMEIYEQGFNQIANTHEINFTSTFGVMSMLNFLYSEAKLAWLQIFFEDSALLSSVLFSPSSFFSCCSGDSLRQNKFT